MLAAQIYENESLVKSVKGNMAQELPEIYPKTLATPKVWRCILLTRYSTGRQVAFPIKQEMIMDIEALRDAVCFEVHCRNNREALKTAVGFLLDGAYTKDVVPSSIDFSVATANELVVTLYSYPRLLVNPG